MTDEKFLFVSDVREKKRIARGAHNKRTHTGKGGKVKFPSDYLTRKELNSMNGEMKTYKLNCPMTWDEFNDMPEDLQVSYIQLIRKRFSVPDSKIGEMMGANKDQISRRFKKLGLGGEKTRKRKNWDSEGFYAWINGVPLATTDDVKAEEPTNTNDSEAFDDPINEENVWQVLDMEVKRKQTVPVHGSMTFKSSARDALNVIEQILQDAVVQISVTWFQAEESE